MPKFYITNNTNRCEPEAIQENEFVHVKAKVDGSQTIIVSDFEIVDSNVLEIEQESAQQILDQWIDEENENPFYDEVNDVVVLQKKIDLGGLIG